MAIDHGGFVLDAAGAGRNGLTVNLRAVSDDGSGAIEATDTTDTNGRYDFAEATQGRYDVQIIDGSSERWRKYSDEWQLETLEVANFRLRNPADTFEYDIIPAAITAQRNLTLPLITGSDTLDSLAVAATYTAIKTMADAIDLALGGSDDALVRWSTGDASNHALVVGLGDTSQALHITDKGAIATDWNIAATTHPNLYIHSNTTPATDYLRIGDHDGTTAYIDVVGGTTLDLEIDGTTVVTITNAAGGGTSSLLHLTSTNVGATNTIRVSNVDNTNGASDARVLAFTGGASGGDPYIEWQVSGSEVFVAGVDGSAGIWVLSRGNAFATDDVIRVTDASPPVITYNTTHPTGTFDYVCESCGRHEPEMFTCCGVVEWHDDVMDFRAVALGDDKARAYMSRIGLKNYELDGLGRPVEFTTLGLDFDFAMSAAFQNRARMDAQYEELDRRLRSIGV